MFSSSVYSISTLMSSIRTLDTADKAQFSGIGVSSRKNTFLSWKLKA